MSKDPATDLVRLTIDARGVATATLNRPEVGNAYNEDLLAELIAGLQQLAPDPSVRCLVLRGAGRHFQAGAALKWIDTVRAATPCVILDLPHAWNSWIRTTLISADEIVVVATPDLASLRNAKNIVDLVRAARPNDAPAGPGARFRD